MAINYVSLVCNYVDGEGNPVAAGRVVFTPSAQVLDTSTDHLLITQAPVMVSLAKSAAPAVRLIATDNADMFPSTWLWQVTPVFPGAPSPQQFSLLYSSGAIQYLSDLVPA